MKREPNILFIVSDALRARNLGCYGYARNVSPNIDALAKDGVLFEKAFSCATVTDPSLTTIFSGKYQRSHGIMKHGVDRKEDIERFVAGGTRLLPEILKLRNYTTLAVDWLGRWHKRGYDCYTGISKKRIGTRALYWLMYQSSKRFRPLYSLTKRLFSSKRFVEDAKTITDKAIELLKKFHERKFFLFVHYWDTHYPYNSPRHYVQKFINHDYGKNICIYEIVGSTPDPETCGNNYPARYVPYRADRWTHKGHNGIINSNEALARYDAAIAFVDHEVRRLLDALEDFGIFEETFVLFTSDHGESLTEHEIYFDHHGLYDVTLHVPLILKYSKFPKNRRIEGLVQHTDMVPTILDIIGASEDGLEFDGRSILPLIYNERKQLHSALYFEEVDWEIKRAVRTSKYKYIYSPSEADAFCRRCGRIHGGLEELYDLKKDSEEIENIIQKESTQATSLRRKLDEWMRSLERSKRKKNLASKVPSYDEGEKREIMERLKKLGYI